MPNPNSLPRHPRLTELSIRDDRFQVEMPVVGRNTAAVPEVRDAGRTVRGDDLNPQILKNGASISAEMSCGDRTASIIEPLRGHHKRRDETIFHEIVNPAADAPSATAIDCFRADCPPRMLQAQPAASVIGVDPDNANLDVVRADAACEGRTISLSEEVAGCDAWESTPFATDASAVGAISLIGVPPLMSNALIVQLACQQCHTHATENNIRTSCLVRPPGICIECFVSSTRDICVSDNIPAHQSCLNFWRQVGSSILAKHVAAESCGGDGAIASYCGHESVIRPDTPVKYSIISKNVPRHTLSDSSKTLA